MVLTLKRNHTIGVDNPETIITFDGFLLDDIDGIRVVALKD